MGPRHILPNRHFFRKIMTTQGSRKVYLYSPSQQYLGFSMEQDERRGRAGNAGWELWRQVTGQYWQGHHLLPAFPSLFLYLGLIHRSLTPAVFTYTSAGCIQIRFKRNPADLLCFITLFPTPLPAPSISVLSLYRSVSLTLSDTLAAFHY